MHAGAAPGAAAATVSQSRGITFPQLVSRILDSVWFGILMTLFTLYSLFGDGIRVAALPKTYDPVFLVLTCITLALFTLEMVMQVGMGRLRRPGLLNC
jgi:hypothetical protein